MRRYRRNSFFKVGILCVSLIVALGLMGVGYAGWVDNATINGLVNTGDIEVVITQPICGPQGQITCARLENVVYLSITAAPSSTTCSFSIVNLGTLPVKVNDIIISSLPEGVTCTPSIVVPTQIDPGQTLDEQILVVTPSDTGIPFDVDITYEIVIWNQ